MKEMIYQELMTLDILDEGIFEDYHYVILSYCSHPCAYVDIPKSHQFYMCDCNDVDVKVHGDLSYNGSLEFVEPHNSGFYFGWDYAHCCDFCANMMRFYPNPKEYEGTHKHWTTKEIFNDVRSVIMQIKSYEVK